MENFKFEGREYNDDNLKSLTMDELQDLANRIHQEEQRRRKPESEKPKKKLFISDFEKRYPELIDLSNSELDNKIIDIANQEVSSLGGNFSIILEELRERYFLYLQYKSELEKDKD